MSQSTRRLRTSVLIAMLAALVLGLFSVATPSANAIASNPSGVPATMTGGGQPDIFRSNGTEGQAAADLTLAADATHSLALINGERIIVEVSDGLDQNCANSTGQFIGFASLPTVTVSAGSNVSVSAQLGSSTSANNLRSNATNCAPPFTPTTNDQLIITVLNAPAPFGVAGSIAISDIQYVVGSQAGTGFATIHWAADVPPFNAPARPTGTNDGIQPSHDVGSQGCSPAGGDGLHGVTGSVAPFRAPGLTTCNNTNRDNDPTGGTDNADSGISNAYITNLQVTAPAANAIRPGAGQTIGDFTLTETDFAAAHPKHNGTPVNPSDVGVSANPAVDGLCVQLVNPIVDFTDAGTATSTGDGAGTPVILNSSTIRIPVTATAPQSMSTFTLSGVQVDTNFNSFGPQPVHVFQCDAAGNHLPTTDPNNNPAQNTDVTEYTNQPIILLVVVNSERYAGTNRNDTARVIADRDFPCNGFFQNQFDQSFAIIARNDDFADALAANYISGQVYAPILLVNTHGPIPQETIDALHTHGVTDVIIMGGPVAVGDDVLAQLDALTSFDCTGAARRTPEDNIRTVNVQRVQGPTRFGTARAAALFAFGGNTIGFLDANNSLFGNHPIRTAIMASGRNFPDAMVAGPMAFQGVSDRFDSGFNCNFDSARCDGFPIILSDGQSSTLPADTQALITERNIGQVIIVGGSTAVPTAIDTALTAQGINVIRLQGNTRQLTAIDVAKFEIAVLGFEAGGFDFNCCPEILGHIALARGDFFTDALAFGPLAGNDPNNTTITNLIQSPGLEPILLTQDANTIGADTLAFLTELSSNPDDPNTGFFNSDSGFGLFIFWIDIAGGTGAISTAAENDALNALVG